MSLGAQIKKRKRPYTKRAVRTGFDKRSKAQICVRLSEARISAGYTAEQAADALSVPLRWYSKVEAGSVQLPVQYVRPVCELFAIDANHLFDVHPSRKADR